MPVFRHFMRAGQIMFLLHFLALPLGPRLACLKSIE